MNCAEGYTYNWATYLAKEFLEDARDAQEKVDLFIIPGY